MLHYLLLVGSLLPGVGFSYAAGAYFRQWRWLLRHGQQVPGTVRRSEVQSSGRGGAYFTKVGFTTANGEEVEIESELGLPWQNFRVGETVRVYYDPARPRRCAIASRAERWGYGGLALVGWLVTGLMWWDLATRP